jgi:hypothetical protein
MLYEEFGNKNNMQVQNTIPVVRCCSFCRSEEHNIRDCHCDAAVNLYEFVNWVLFDMTEMEQKNCLNNYSSRELKMMSVILDLKILYSKAEIIDSIVHCLLEKKARIAALRAVQRNVFAAKTVVIESNLFDETNDEEAECPICLNSYNISKTFKTNCNHVFCNVCMISHLKHDVHCKCPICRTKVTHLESNQYGGEPPYILGQHEYEIDEL